jgi:hypothetical protein
MWSSIVEDIVQVFKFREHTQALAYTSISKHSASGFPYMISYFGIKISDH